MLITKRDETTQSFDLNKITKSILACFAAVGEESISEVSELVAAVEVCVHGPGHTEVTVARVQRCTESTLFDYGYKDAAAAFMEYRIERDLIRESRRKPDPDALSHYIHQAKYARWLSAEGRRENYSETVDRVVEMHYQRFSDQNSTHSYSDRGNISDEITKAFRYVYSKQVLPSMRSMQFAGPAIEKNNARMYNCCFTHVDRVRVFSETLFLLLSGCGVGYSVQWEHVDMLPLLTAVGRQIYHHSIDDSIEGWADALHMLVSSYMGPAAGSYVEFDYSHIRAEGEVLRTSGGRAPGHLGLKAMLEEVRTVLQAAQGRKLRPIECHDMMCYIARAVLSGGIRRSSMISLFSASDTEMMYCKSKGVFDPVSLNTQRAMTNNSAVLIRNTVSRSLFDRIITLSSQNYGDPGFVFVDHYDCGINPCGEITMNPRCAGYEHAGFAFCDLTEVNAANCPSENNFIVRCAAAATIATLQACYISFPYLSPASQAIAERDRLIGVSITGIMDNPSVMDWMVAGRKVVIETNKHIAKMLGINASDRCTCIKPSGTASLLLGTSSGIHCHHSRRYLRRVTVNPQEVVGRAFALSNPHMVEQKPNGDYVLVFPVQARDDAIVQIDGADFVRMVREVLSSWCGKSGHNVSCTVPVRDDLSAIIDYVWEQRHSLSALSFASVDLSKRYPFAPLEAIDDAVLEAYWDVLIKEYTPVDWSNIGEVEDGTSPTATAACESERCDYENH